MIDENKNTKDNNIVIKEITNYNNAWNFMVANLKNKINLNYICKINLLIGDGNIIPNAGQLRKINVKIGEMEWRPELPDKKMIQKKLTEINSIMDIRDRAITMMLFLMRSQLFHDGNKRTSLLIANKIMLQYSLAKISISTKNQEKFMKLLIDYYKSDNMKKIKKFIIDKCIVDIMGEILGSIYDQNS